MNADFMGAWLFDTLLTTTLLMAAILIVRRPVAKHFGPTIALRFGLYPLHVCACPRSKGHPFPQLTAASPSKTRSGML